MTEEALYPVAFYFKVGFPGATEGLDVSFQEVDGITAKMEVESYHEGGENRFRHNLPMGVSHGNLILKRAIAETDSPLVRWCKNVLEGGMGVSVDPTEVHVKLLDASGTPIRVWSFSNAFPVRWDVEPFNSTKNSVAIETIELSYTYSNRSS